MMAYSHRTFSAGLPVLLFAALLLRPDLANAQFLQQYKVPDRYRYLPLLPPANENPPPMSFDDKPVKGDEKVLLKSLNAIVVLGDAKDVQKPYPDTTGIHIHTTSRSGLVETAEFQEILQSYLGTEVSIRRLNELSREIVLFYRQNDLPVVDVSVPQQDITNGVVQLVIREATVGEVRVEGTRFFDPCILVNQTCISSGDLIYESVLASDQRWLYRNPFRTVDVELTPGDEPGETDVVFNVYDKLPWRSYAGYEDTGTRATGLERGFVGFNWYNALWRDDQFGYQFTGGSDLDRFAAHSAYYSTALLNRDIVSLYGSYATFTAPPNAVNILNTNGTVWQVLARWYRELCPCGNFEHAVNAGIDLKESNTNLEFGGVRVFGSPFQIFNLMAGYHAKATDNCGSYNYGIDFYYSPGNAVPQNSNAVFQTIRPFASAHYFYGRAYAERRYWLPHCLELVGRITGQASDGNLMPTEQLGFGGYNSIRGYDMFAVARDAGYFANIELWTPPMYPTRLDDELRLLAFYDFGNSYQHTLLPGELQQIDLQSIGMGARYVARPNVEFRFDFGYQVTQIPTALALPRERVHIGAVISY